MFPGDPKWSWERIAELYRECRELADRIDGQPCFELVAFEQFGPFHDPKTHQFWLRWEGRVSGFYESGRICVGREYRLVDNAPERIWSMMMTARNVMTSAWVASRELK